MKSIEVMTFEEWNATRIGMPYCGCRPENIPLMDLAYYSVQYGNYLSEKMREIVKEMEKAE